MRSTVISPEMDRIVGFTGRGKGKPFSPPVPCVWLSGIKSLEGCEAQLGHLEEDTDRDGDGGYEEAREGATGQMETEPDETRCDEEVFVHDIFKGVHPKGSGGGRKGGRTRPSQVVLQCFCLSGRALAQIDKGRPEGIKS